MGPNEGIPKKKRDGNGMMNFERQKKYRDKGKEVADLEKMNDMKRRKKDRDRLRYLLKKEEKSSLSGSEAREKKTLQGHSLQNSTAPIKVKIFLKIPIT